jgi:NTE family protein
MHATKETARAHNELHAESHRLSKRPPFECIALLLQGGGALGSYQAGVYEALAEANRHPDWVAGISIGALNSAIIAGNAPTERVEKLRTFWREITAPPCSAGPPRSKILGSKATSSAGSSTT